MTDNCRVKIVGGTGYSGGELIRLLINHPQAEIVSLTSSSAKDPVPLHSFWPRLRKAANYMVTLEEPGDGGDADIVFLCTPHGASMDLAPKYIENGYTVIDLSADFRFNDPAEREGFYDGVHSAPELCKEAVYGMPELFRDQIASARMIACPGCYPTTAILGLYPAIKADVIEFSGIHVSSASGVTGAGKKPKAHLHHPELDQNFFAYRVGNHQHLPEILSVLKRATSSDVSLSFVPHVLPLQRGILSTIFCKRSQDISLEALWDVYNDTYKDESFIRVYPLGEAPTLHAVRETNFLDIGLFEDCRSKDIIILSAEDNLLKGASGQAVQCMNLKMGYPEVIGLLNA